MRLLAALLLISLMAASHAEAMPRDWRDTDLGQAIIEGVATRDHIWLRGGTRKVVRFDRATGERTVVADNVIDILAHDGRIWLLGQRNGMNLFYVVDLTDPGSAAGIGPTPRQGDRTLNPGEEAEGQVLGLVSSPDLDRPTIVFQRGVVPLVPGGRRFTFAGALGPYGHTALADDRTLYVGYNRGEWGGGLRIVDLETGALNFARGQTGSGCEGDLNPACAPIVGLFADRDRLGCVVVGSGLSHLGISNGRVYRVCGLQIELVFSTPTPAVGDRWMRGPQPWPLDGLFEVPGGWVATSRDRYFRSNEGRTAERPMPAFRDWAGLRISDEQDGFLLLIAACCWGSAEHPTLYRAMAIPVL